MQDLTKKNTQLSQELEECKAQLEATLAASGSAKGTPQVIYALKDKYVVKCGMCAILTITMQMGPEWIRTSNNSCAS